MRARQLPTYSVLHFKFDEKLIFVKPNGRRMESDVVFVDVHSVECTLRAYKSSCSVYTGTGRSPRFVYQAAAVGTGRGSRRRAKRHHVFARDKRVSPVIGRSQLRLDHSKFSSVSHHFCVNLTPKEMAHTEGENFTNLPDLNSCPFTARSATSVISHYPTTPLPMTPTFGPPSFQI